MKTFTLHYAWAKTMHQKLYAFFLTMFCLASLSSLAQKPDCGSINCTANDVQIVKAYFTGPNGEAITCPDGGGKVTGYLHVVVSTNTPRKGVSVSGDLVIDGSTTSIGACFNNDLNGSNNELVFPNTFEIECTSTVYLAKSLVSWGVGNTQYCTGTGAQCPATKSKCRFTEGQIPVVIKLDVFFDWLAGDCSADGNGLEVKFTPSLSLENVTVTGYSWDFGDGGTSTEESPTHTYATANTYDVKLTVTGTKDDGSGSIEKSITLPVTVATCCNLTPPNLGPFTYCELENKTFGDLPQTDGNGGFYNWFDESDNALDPNAVIPVGEHTYKVTLSKDNCESGKSSVSVTVTAKRTPTFDAIPDICSGDNFTLPPASKEGITGTWSPAIDKTQTTVYTFTPTDGQCATTATLTVTVKPRPSVAKPDNQTVCNGDNTTAVTFTGSSVSGTEYAWTNNKISIGLAANGTGDIASFQAVNPGSTPVVATITVTPSADGCSGTQQSFTITVNPTPSSSFSGSSTCASTNTTYTAADQRSGNTFKWYVNDVLKGTEKTLTVANGSAGSSYVVKLCVTNSYGCSTSTSQTITVGSCGYTTLSQGFYGNTTGKACTANGKNDATAVQILTAWLAGGSRVIGNGSGLKYLSGFVAKGAGKITINSGDASLLNGIMPGGSTPNRINTTQTGLLALTTGSIPKSSGKIANVLITQTITLGVNIFRNGPLANVILEPSKYATVVKSSTKCVIPTSCVGNTVTSVKMPGVSTAFATYINGKTVQYLYDLANDALGGGNLPTGVSYSDINAAVDFVNKLFDGGALYLGNFSTAYVCGAQPITVRNPNVVEESIAITALKISAAPNPFTDKIRFTIQTPKAGRATLEVYNMLGQKVGVPFEGSLNAGETRNVEYNAPVNNRSNLIYMLRMNGEQVSGKLMSTRQ